MKRIICILLPLLFVKGLSAQMDEKFYHPDKKWIKVDSLSFEEIILYPDNDTVHSILIKPGQAPKATVLYFHPNRGNISVWIEHIRPLVKDGFQVCMLDYRGFGKSTGTPTHLNIAYDAQKLLDTLLNREDVRHTKLIVYGASIGSQVAANLTRNNNEKISALVLDGPMPSFTDVALLTTPVEYHEQVKQFVLSPYSAKEDIKVIKGIKLLFIHSEEDPIPMKDVREIYNSSPCVKTFWVYKGKHIEAPVKYPEIFTEYMNNLL